MDEDGLEVAEWLRLAILWTLIAANAWMVYDAMKDRPEVVVLRKRIHDALLAPLKRARDLRRAESRVVWEAMETVAGEETREHGS